MGRTQSQNYRPAGVRIKICRVVSGRRRGFMPEPAQVFLARVGQMWKLRLLTWASFPLIAIFVAGQILLQRGNRDLGVALILAFTGVGLALSVWVAASVRCPRCGARLVLKAVQERTPGEWY